MDVRSPTANRADGSGGLVFGPFRFDLDDRTLYSADEEVSLPPRACDTLAHLLGSPGKVVTKEELLEAAWPGVFVSDSALKEAIFLIRQALGDDPRKPTYIQTVHRRGYRFVAPVSSSPRGEGAADRSEAAAGRRRQPPAAGAGGRQIPRSPLRWAIGVAAAVAGLAVVGVAGLALVRDRVPAPPLPLTHVTFELAAPNTLKAAGLAISADGRKLVYVAKDEDRRLFLRRMDELEPSPIDGTVGAQRPFFSPDDRWLGFFAQGKLQVVPVTGGTARVLADAPAALGACWGPSGTLVFAGEPQAGLRRVAAAGGSVEELTSPEAAGVSHRWPELLPGGDAVLYTLWRGRLDDSAIALLDLATGDSTVLVEGGSSPRFVPPGYLLYSRPNQLMAVLFDLESGTLAGTPVPVLDGLDTNFSHGGAEIAISGDGTAAYIREQLPIAERVLEWTDFQDRRDPIPVAPGRYFDVALAPDGRRVALTVSQGQGSDVWLADLESGERQRLTYGNQSGLAVWRPAGEDVIYLSRDGDRGTLLTVPADGSTAAEVLHTCDGLCVPLGVSPDERLIYLAPAVELGGMTLYVTVGGSSAGTRVLDPPERVRDAALSPRGRWLAYESRSAGSWEIFVQPFSGRGGKWQISIGGGTSPRWSADGRRLYYQAQDQLIAVAVETGSAFRAEGREHRMALDGVFAWELAPDGERLLRVKAAPGASSNQRIDVVFGWSTQLRRLLGSG